MQWEDLLVGLNAPDPGVRADAALVIGTLDEVAALDALADHYRAESDARVKAALNWAGKRLHAARQSGYTTLDALIAHFHIDAAWQTPTEDPQQQARLRALQYKMEMDALRDQEAAAGKKALGRLASGAMLGLPGLLMSQPASLDSDALKVDFNLHLTPVQRALPTRPADTDITRLVQRLLHDSDPAQRARAANDLAVIVNNPQALPPLARAFVKDRAQPVREAAQQAAKRLYWNAIYWQMEQDGSMAAEIARRSGQPAAPVVAADPPMTPVDDKPDAWHFEDSPPIDLPVRPPSLLHRDRSSRAETSLDDLLAAEYIDSPGTSKAAPSPEKPKRRGENTLLLTLVIVMVVLIAGGIVLLAAEGARVAHEITTDPEFVSMVNAINATPENFDQMPADAHVWGTVKPFEPIRGTLQPGRYDAWVFSGTAGDGVALTVVGLHDDDPDPRLYLYSPDGVLLAERSADAGMIVGTTVFGQLPLTGTYTLVLAAVADASSDYELTLQYFSTTE